MNDQFPIDNGKPNPSRSKTSQGRLFKFFLEMIKTTPGCFNGLSKCTFWFTSGIGCHPIEVECVVPYTSPIVPDGGGSLCRHRFLKIQERNLHLRRSGYGFVQVVNISLVVFAIMDLHSRFVNRRFKRIECVW